MRSEFTQWNDGPGTPVVEANAAARAVQALGWTDPLILGVAPAARGNPFQAQLYREFASEGVATVDLNRAAAYSELVALTANYSVATHFHWLSWLLSGATSSREARIRLDQFRLDIDAFIEKRGRIAWTMHNVLPHDARFITEEIELRQFVAERASLIHAMSRESVSKMGEVVKLDPDKVVVSAHPNYAGCYPDSVGRVEARRALGIEPDELVFVMFGALKPYKGLDLLLDGFSRVARKRGRVRLLVAGAPDGTPEAERFVQRCLVHPDVLIADRRIATEHVQYFMRSADVGVASYVKTLNSGAVNLYGTFRLPVVVPNEPSITSTVPNGMIAVFQELTASSLADAMMRAGELEPVDTQRAIAEFLTASAAGPLSSSLARRFRTVLA